tara:strand:- start:1536 stop:1964 length:429 start_codon:yes stop_codon:yes gene_type:complete
MASILKVDTLTGVTTAGSISVTGEGNSTTTNLQQGLTKSWASIDQTSTDHPVYDSFNVSGTADIATGVTKITFSNAMNNANYVTTGGAQTEATSAAYFGTYGVNTSTSRQMTTADFHTSNRNTSGSDKDVIYFAFDVKGDLA